MLHKKIHPSFLLVSEWCLSNVRIPHGHAVRRFLPRLFKKNETVGNIWELSTPKLQPVSKNKGILYDCDRSGWANLNWTSTWEILNHYFLDSLAGNVLSPMMNNSLKNPDSHFYLGQMIYMKWKICNYILLRTLPETSSSPLKIDPWKRRFLLETTIFRAYVSFRECIFIYIYNMCIYIYLQYIYVCIYIYIFMQLWLLPKELQCTYPTITIDTWILFGCYRLLHPFLPTNWQLVELIKSYHKLMG